MNVRTVPTAITAAVFSLALGLAPSPTHANEESILLTNKALVHLEDGEPGEALRLLEEAIAADASDEDARYHLAHVHLTRGNYQGALDVLDGHTLANWDEHFIRGLCHLRLNRPEKAEQAFQASIRATRDPESRFYLGLLRYRAGELESAASSFRRAGKLADAELEPYRRFYMGLIANARDRGDAANRHFTAVQEEFPDSPAAELAADVQREGADAVAEAQPAAPRDREPEASDGGFLLRFSLAEEFDTNPGLVQSDSSVAREFQPELTDTTAALRTVLASSIGANLGGDQGFGAMFGIGGYGSLHLGNADANTFNVIQGRAFFLPRYAFDRGVLLAPMSYARTWLGDYLGWHDGSEFFTYNDAYKLGVHYVYPLLDMLRLRGGVAYAFMDFNPVGDSRAADERTGSDLTLPFKLTARLTDRLRLVGGYDLGFYLPRESGSPWRYTKNRLHASAEFRPVQLLSLSGGVAYTNRQYANDYPSPLGGAKARTDNQAAIDLGTALHVFDHGSLNVSYRGVFQRSISEFTYDQHVVSAQLAVDY